MNQEAIANKTIPTSQECSQLWNNYHTPDNVCEHLQLVRDIALYLGKKLVEGGEPVDLNLVEAGALLHDFLRFVGLGAINLKYLKEPPTYEDMGFWQKLDQKYSGYNHAQAAGKELRELGYPEELAQVVEKHDFSKIIDPDEGPQTWEERLVFYADKRVLHRQIVSLAIRFSDGEDRYPQFMNAPGEQIKRVAIYELEKEIFDKIGMKPEEITSEIIKPVSK